MNRKKLNILMYVDSFNERWGLGLNYFKLIGQYGNVVGIGPYNASWKALMEADVLVLPGGADVDPARYNEEPDYFTQRGNLQYEWLDRNFLPEWIKTGKPILGICRGMQTLNVAMGGTLFQHIIGHVGDNTKRDKPIHEVYTDIKNDWGDFRIHEVNSFHHQCVKDLAEGFEVIGWSDTYRHCPSISKRNNLEKRYSRELKWEYDKKGNIVEIPKESRGVFYAIPEIIKHIELPYLAVQYHPEDMNCPLFHYLATDMLDKYYGI